jgi:hypothetical protein
MKHRLWICLLTLATLAPAPAGVYFYDGAPSIIPDGNLSGVWSSITVTGETASLAHVTATLNVSGGYNGDLYAYLNFGGRLVPLLNRIGVSGGNPFGSAGAGMNATLSDRAAGNIHAAGNGYLSGTYRADGQDISPLSGPASFSANGGSLTLDGTFGNLDPNGVWTLFIADVVSSGDPSLLNSWSLNITVVPEPGVTVLALGAILAGMRARRWKL